jgi:SHS2 domain-containing protein
MNIKDQERTLPDKPGGECHTIEHTADIGLRCRAPTLENLFECAARAMFELIVSLDSVEPVKSVPVAVKAASLEELFVSWLEELLYIWESKRILLSSFAVKKVSSDSLEAEVAGEPYDAGRHDLQSEIKAATYHGLRIERTEDGWDVQVIFDV